MVCRVEVKSARVPNVSSRIPVQAVVVLSTLLISACGESNKFQAPPPPEVTVIKPLQRKVTLYADFTGTTAATKKVDLVARVQGFVEKIGYTDGQQVKKDQTLFVIEKLPYETSLQIAEAAQAQSQAQLTTTEADFGRQTTLSKDQFAAQAKLDSSRAARDSAAAALEQAKGQVQQAKINLGYTEIKAPFDGIVSAHLADVGALVGPSGPAGPTKLATILQVAPIYVTFTVNEQQVLQIRQQLRSEGRTIKDLGPIPVEIGLQTENSFPHKGTIDYLAPELDASTGTMTVRAVLDNKDVALTPGLFVKVRVPATRDLDAMLVPDSAIGTSQSGHYLLVVSGKNVVEQHTVDIGDLVDGHMRFVKSGLKPDDRVVIGGLQRAIPGTAVNPVEQQATANATAPATGTKP